MRIGMGGPNVEVRGMVMFVMTLPTGRGGLGPVAGAAPPGPAARETESGRFGAKGRLMRWVS